MWLQSHEKQVLKCQKKFGKCKTLIPDMWDKPDMQEQKALWGKSNRRRPILKLGTNAKTKLWKEKRKMALFQEAWTFVICKLVKTDMRDEPAMQCRIKSTSYNSSQLWSVRIEKKMPLAGEARARNDQHRWDKPRVLRILISTSTRSGTEGSKLPHLEEAGMANCQI